MKFKFNQFLEWSVRRDKTAINRMYRVHRKIWVKFWVVGVLSIPINISIDHMSIWIERGSFFFYRTERCHCIESFILFILFYGSSVYVNAHYQMSPKLKYFISSRKFCCSSYSVGIANEPRWAMCVFFVSMIFFPQ